MGVSFFIDCAFVLWLTISYQLIVNNLLDNLILSNNSTDAYFTSYSILISTPTSSSNYSSLYSQNISDYNDMIRALNLLIDQLRQIRYISWVFFLYIFKDINIALFAKLRHKQIYHYTIEFWLTFLSTFFTATLIYKVTGYFNVSISESNPEYSTAVGTNIVNDKSFQFYLWLGIIVAVQWVRVFMVFQTSPTFGKVVEIIINMLAEISKFMVILIIILISFSSAGRILFFDMNQFSSDDQSSLIWINSHLMTRALFTW